MLSVLDRPSDGTVIWRYMDVPKFLSLLHSGLYFTRPGKFSDTWDGLLPNSSINYVRHALAPMGDEKELAKLDESLRRLNHVNCWHMSNNESPSFWEMYAKRGGLAVKSSVGSLEASLLVSNLRISKVHYVNHETYSADVSRGIGYFASALYKRQEFSEEAEVRVIKTCEWGDADSEKEGVLVPVNIQTLIHEVRTCPESGDWLAAAVDDVCKRFGLEVSVIASRFYAPRNLTDWVNPYLK